MNSISVKNLISSTITRASVTERNEICEGSNVLVYITDQRPKCWCKGIVLHGKGKTYDIQLENGKIINRNCVDI